METHPLCTDDLEIHFIELNEFDQDLLHIKTTLDRWTTFLTKAYRYDSDTLPQELKEVPSIEKAMLSLNTLSLNRDEREVYEARLKWLMDEASAIEKALEKGREEGIHLGEQKKELHIVKNMLTRGMAVDMISEVTGLTIEAIEGIKQS